MFIKICGFKKAEDIQVATREEINAAGIIVGTTHYSPDAVSVSDAIRLIAKVPKHIMSVVVTHFVELYSITSLCEVIKPGGIQIQGDVSLQTAKEVRNKLKNIKIIKAIHVTGEEAINRAVEFDEVVDYILLDSRTPTRIGGTGLTHEWSISAQIVQKVKSPVILAGGLTPENVIEAIQTVRPFGVDVNTGTKGKNGFKDYEKIKEFVRNAKSAYCGSNPH